VARAAFRVGRRTPHAPSACRPSLIVSPGGDTGDFCGDGYETCTCTHEISTTAIKDVVLHDDLLRQYLLLRRRRAPQVILGHPWQARDHPRAGHIEVGALDQAAKEIAECTAHFSIRALQRNELLRWHAGELPTPMHERTCADVVVVPDCRRVHEEALPLLVLAKVLP
jgi:hypothetical protein